MACFLARGRRRESSLAIFGPLSILILMACWATALVFGFAMIQWGLGSRFNAPTGNSGFWTDLYLSGTTLFTLGIGDVTPIGPLARALTVIEAGVGFGFLALVMGYLPVLYQGFSRREVNISLLDARAGSPPSAGELLRRHGHDMPELETLLRDWERWSAELMESHLSYPVLMFFRSQHEHQSWLGALTAVLDASALVMVGVEGAPGRQAQLTFAMARHAVVDLAMVTGAGPSPGGLSLAESEPGSGRRRIKGWGGGRADTGLPARHVRALRDGAGATPATFPARLARRGPRARRLADERLGQQRRAPALQAGRRRPPLASPRSTSSQGSSTVSISDHRAPPWRSRRHSRYPMSVAAASATHPRKSQRRRSVVKNTTARSPITQPTSAHNVV